MIKSARRDVIFSIKPKFADQIMAGDKTVELRRRFAKDPVIGARAFIYSSSPLKRMLGYATITHVDHLPIAQIWERYGPQTGVTRKQVFDYFHGTERGYVIVLKQPRRFPNELTMEQLKKRFGFRAPQSYRYAGSEYRALLR